MNLKANIVAFFVILLFFLSCKNQEDAMIEAELDKVRTSWNIQSFEVTGNVPDSLKKTF